MGNSSSHTHEPLERGFTRGGKFGDVKNSVRIQNLNHLNILIGVSFFSRKFKYCIYVLLILCGKLGF